MHRTCNVFKSVYSIKIEFEPMKIENKLFMNRKSKTQIKSFCSFRNRVPHYLFQIDGRRIVSRCIGSVIFFIISKINNVCRVMNWFWTNKRIVWADLSGYISWISVAALRKIVNTRCRIRATDDWKMLFFAIRVLRSYAWANGWNWNFNIFFFPSRLNL